MKKLIVFFLIIVSISFGQVRKTGDISTPFSTLGWDAPHSFSSYYGLPFYRLLSNPGGWINISQRMIDSLFNKLIVFTDVTQLCIRNDTLVFSDSLSYQGSFSTTDTTDTVFVNGMDSLDVVVICARETDPKAYLWTEVITGGVVANRSSGTVSGLKYNWIYIKRYQ
jgi:hypothetical protein